MIELQPFEQCDECRLLGWVTDPVTLAHWAGAVFRYPVDPQQLETYRRSVTTAAPARHIFKALDTDISEVVGHVELSDVWPYLSARVARVLVGPTDLRGRGIGAAIVDAAVQIADREYQVSRVDLGVRKENIAGRKCYAKVGFREVGTWPGAISTPVFDIDVVWMTRVLRG